MSIHAIHRATSPSQAEIRDRCGQIQALWTTKERVRRSATDSHWLPPVVRTADLVRQIRQMATRDRRM